MLSTIVMLFLAQAVLPASPHILDPHTRYRSDVPTLKQAVGHDLGDEITSPEEIAVYLRALAAAAPDRSRLVEYARSWEGRALHLLVIGSSQRIAQLDRIQEDLRRLADPRKFSAGDAERLVRGLPIVILFMHAVHGNEISPPEAALALAYHLLAAHEDAAVEAILRETIILIDPLENPDGRARFLLQNLLSRATAPDPEPASAEHDEPWPGGRSNHYLFDMNRDWFVQSQPETRGRTRLYLQWYPHVVVDLHEMGGDSSYYFAPPAAPLNPHITKRQAALLELFGRETARRFDDRGFAYFNRETFDSFYPGYGESWAIFQGAIGMTYEQASTRGLIYRRQDETLLTFREAIAHHFTAALATAETAAHNRERILRDFFQYRRSAVEEGETGAVRDYLLPPGQDPARTERLVRLLASQGIEVRRAEAPIPVGSRTLPAGTYIVTTGQPAGRLLRNLVDPDTPQPEAFIKEQDRRRKRRLPEEFYDVTGWSLPQAFDVEVLTSDRTVPVRSVPLSAEGGTSKETLPPAKVAYLLPWGSGAAGAVVEALRAGIRVSSANLPFTFQGRRFQTGTAVVRIADNGADIASRLGPLVARHQAEAVPADSGYVDEGISLGSDEMVPLKVPRVLLAWDSPTQSQSAGWARYTLEQRFRQPVSAVRVNSLRRVDLRRYDVLVLPAGDYSSVLSGDALRRIKDWITSGGTLVTLGEASRWAAREKVDLLATHTEWRDGRPETESEDKEQKKGEAPPKPIDLEKAILPEREQPESTPGALLRVLLDTEHWLSAGTDGEIQAMVEGRRVFTPLKLDRGRNVGVYATKERLTAAGLVWEEAQQLLAQKAFLMHQPLGRGQVIAFAEDPNYRAFTEATQLLFLNAVVLAPAR